MDPLPSLSDHRFDESLIEDTARGPKLFFSYEAVHELCRRVCTEVVEKFSPEVVVAIGTGGFPVARMIKTYLADVKIVAVGVEFYDDSTCTPRIEKNENGEEVALVRKYAWLDKHALEFIKGKRVLVVDEVDDTRTTLSVVVRDVLASFPAPEAVAVCVALNKDKPKRAEIDQRCPYFAAMTVPDRWIRFPWDAEDIMFHTKVAERQCELHREELAQVAAGGTTDD